MHKDDHPLSVGGCFLYEVGKKSFFISDLAQYKQACQLLSGFHYLVVQLLYEVVVIVGCFNALRLVR